MEAAPPEPQRRRSFVDRAGQRARTGDPGRPTRGGQAFVRAVSGLVRALFRPRIEGLEHVPRGRAFLLVANHSGGGVAEVAALAVLWQDAMGERSPLAGFAHPVAFYIPGVAAFLRAVGAVPSTYDHAHRALSAGASLLIFPGGDHEAFRPIWQARRVDFGGREGFARIALQARVPVVPLGIRGSHVTVPILWRSGLLARLLIVPRLVGLKRVPVTLLGLAGAIGIGLLLRDQHAGLIAAAVYAWVVLPLGWSLPIVPSRITFHVGAPLEPDALLADGVGPAAARIEAAVQALVRPT